MGLSSWGETWLLKASGPKFSWKNVVSPCSLLLGANHGSLKNSWAHLQVPQGRHWAPTLLLPWQLASNLFSLFKQLGRHNEPNCTMINAFPRELSSRKYSQVLLEKDRLNLHSPWGVICSWTTWLEKWGQVACPNTILYPGWLFWSFHLRKSSK
jgi:hypothetical protein